MAIPIEPMVPIRGGHVRSSLTGRIIAVVLMVLAMVVVAYALAMGQMSQDAPPAIDASRRAAVVDSVATLLQTRYVFPDVAEEMAKVLRRNLKKKEYLKKLILML